MIPYDDLVAALQQWRLRQGLPVSTLGGGSAAAPQPGSGPHAQPGSGPYGTTSTFAGPGSGPNRGAPPAPPRSKPHSVPPPMMEEMAVDDDEMLEEHYEPEGNDYAMAFGANGNEPDETSIGGAPERPTDPSDFRGGRGGRGGNDW